MAISGVDAKEAARLLKKHQRQENLKRTEQACFPSTSQTDTVPVRVLPPRSQSLSIEPSTKSDLKESPSNSFSRNTLTLPTVAKVCN